MIVFPAELKYLSVHFIQHCVHKNRNMTQEFSISPNLIKSSVLLSVIVGDIFFLLRNSAPTP